MMISAIAAMAKNRVIGKNNEIPWHLPDDLRWFMQKTEGHIIVSGRKNYEALGKALPRRENLILTRDENWAASDARRISSLDEAIDYAREQGEDELFIIGGGQVYDLAMPLVERIYLTEIDAEVDGDVFFPELGSEWKEEHRTHHPADEKHKWSFSIITYVKD